MQPYPTIQNYGSYPQFMGAQPIYQNPMPQDTRSVPLCSPYMGTNGLNLLQGKIVDSMDSVRATDIPMDGQTYYFPKADGTEVYAKRWLPNGKTEVTVYAPYTAEAEEAKSQEYTELLKRFDSIDEKFEKLEKSLKAPAKSTNSKKEEN